METLHCFHYLGSRLSKRKFIARHNYTGKLFFEEGKVVTEPVVFQHCSIVQTYEGENTVLYLQTAIV